jgi:hypothetical protein
MGGGAAFRHGHVFGVGHGYPEDWMASTKKTIEDELRSRGISPETINEVTNKIKEPPSILVPVLLSIAVTAVICTLIFVVIWKNA